MPMAREVFNASLSLVRKGNIIDFKEEKLLQLAAENAFPIEEVQLAFTEGKGTAFNSALENLRKGNLAYEKEARWLVTNHGQPLECLEETLPIARNKAFDNLLERIRTGAVSLEKDARELSKQHGLPAEKIEEVLPAGKKAAFEQTIERILHGDIFAKANIDAFGLLDNDEERTKQLGVALKTGYKVHFQKVLKKVQYPAYESYARQLAAEHGYPVELIEQAKSKTPNS